MNDAFTNLENKYGTIPHQDPAPMPPAPAALPKPMPLPKSWKDSEDVVVLSNFIKATRHLGVAMAQTRDGYPILRIGPQVPVDLMEDAIHFMTWARPDLEHLIKIGAMPLPTLPYLTRSDLEPERKDS